MKKKKLNVSIIGSGNIGCDLLCKVQRSDFLNCSMFVGRRRESEGMLFARNLGIPVFANGIDSLLENIDEFDLLMDASSAASHLIHAKTLKPFAKKMINLTPADIGELCIPIINGDDMINIDNVNMITCGGQASLPILSAINSVHENIEYVEVVSSISSKSAGPATRINLSHYLQTTENAIKHFISCKKGKAILNINPAEPCVHMQTAVSALIENADLCLITKKINDAVLKVQKYVKGYQISVPPQLEDNRFFVMVKVEGQGDYLPPYAGNLDIITSAAVAVAEKSAQCF